MSHPWRPPFWSFLATVRRQESGGWTFVWVQGVLVRPCDWIEVVWTEEVHPSRYGEGVLEF